MNTADTASALGVTARTLRRWREDGMPAERDGRHWSYDLDAIRQWLEDRDDDDVATGAPAGLREELLRARIRNTLAQAARNEELLRLSRGELLEASEVEQGRLERIAAARGVLLGMPATLAGRVAHCDSETVERAVRAEVHKALEELSRK